MTDEIEMGGKDEDILNLYETLPKKYKEEERHYEKESKINIKLPFMMCITGATGSGKTNAIVNIVRTIGAFDKIMLWAKNTEESLYASFIDDLREAEKKSGASILSVSNTLDDLPDVKSINKDNNTLLIIDDMITEKSKSLDKVTEYWIRGRKQHCSCMFLSQSYFKIPKTIRDNSFYFIFSKITGDRDLQLILKDYKLGVSDSQLVALYDKATTGGFPNFFMIDVKTNDKNLRFRRNLKGMSTSGVADEGKDAKHGGPVHAKTDVEEKEKPAKKAPKPKKTRDTKNFGGNKDKSSGQPGRTVVRDTAAEEKDKEKSIKAEEALQKKKESEDKKMEQEFLKLRKKQEADERREAAKYEREMKAEAKRAEKEMKEYMKEMEKEEAIKRKRESEIYNSHPFNQPSKMEMDNPHQYERVNHRQKYEKMNVDDFYPDDVDMTDTVHHMDTGRGIGKKRNKKRKRSSQAGGSLDAQIRALVNALR